MRLRLAPLPFFIGLGVGLVALSWLGATVESTGLARNFARFHQYINVESGHFPTARQIRSIIDYPNDRAPQVFVVVGGTSVFHGVGQHESLLWTRLLQKQLGPEFGVFNFAQRAGSMADFGNIAAELLLLRSQPVIFVGDASIYNVGIPLQASFYRHIMFDAWSRGYLLPWAPRDAILSGSAWRGPESLRGPALGALLNSYLNYNDLWSFVAYEYVNLNWNWLLAKSPLQPRRMFPDPDPFPEQYLSRRYLQNIEQEMHIVRAQIRSPDDPRWQRSIAETDQMIPLRLRAVALAVIQMNSPYYLDRLNAAERAAFIAQGDEHARRLREIGFNRAMVAAKGFTADDYIDRIHLSASGGQKLATELAPVIRAMATDLGYLP
jgi:hypothetical protein